MRMAQLFAPSLLVSFLVLLAISDPAFFRAQNLYNVTYTAALLWPATAGMHLLLLTGHFDLASGGTAALVGVLSALVAAATGSTLLAVLAGVLTGALVGFASACGVLYGRIHSLITTLAVLGIARSIALVLSEGSVVAGLSPGFEALARARIVGVELPVILAAITFSSLALLASNAVAIRRFYQVGSNSSSADICGIATNQVVMTAFVAASVGAAIAGILGSARTMTGSPLSYDSLAIDALAACVIGGTSLDGGRGNAAGAAIGTFVVVVTRNIVVILGVSIYWRSLFVGVILLAAALIDQMIRPGRFRMSTES